MAHEDGRPSLFSRAMNLADRFFDGVDKFKKLGEEAERRNIEILDEQIPGFKDSIENSKRSAAALGKKFELKTEKILFGRELNLGPSLEGEPKKKSSLDDMIHSAEKRSISQNSNNVSKDKGKDPVR